MTDPTVRLGAGRAAEVFPHGDGTIIKLLRWEAPASHLAREAAAQAAAQAAGVPAPEVHGIEMVDGRPGIVMDRVDGLDGLTAMDRRPWRIWQIGRDLGKLHRQLASVEAPPGIRPLMEVLRHAIETSPRVPERARSQLLELLETMPGGDRLCHMDLHPGNVIESPAGPVVIDFAAAMSGHPLADHVRSLVIFEAGEPPADTPRRERVLIAIGRGLAKRAYRSGYGRVDAAAARRWRPLIVAWRLDEGIEEERKRLLRQLSRGLREARDV